MNSDEISVESSMRYEKEEAIPVRFAGQDKTILEKYGVNLVEGNFVDIKKGYIRHDAPAIAAEITNYVEKAYYIKKKQCPIE